MRPSLYKLAALSALLIAAGCQTTQPGASDAPDEPSTPNPHFAGEMAKFNAQFPNAKATRYEDESIAHNNKLKLDEKGNCHAKAKAPVTIILLLDASGRVTSTHTDVENSKAACFRKAYAGAQFPAPPMAPYRKAILLR